ncbi:PREDICTED: uncharacterized protein LOC101300838 [Fragaria vesca subsp. vesca]|uniref:uncharacterized protein LOC101300838 n=1 Tax=Fragaria vesca subsp. vesca TaxID=101020 RepID=UPI0002C34977|nr:PREDICTED: uncharacterized protein LOC101300838 [Fragaria vesca subsp. vesca]
MSMHDSSALPFLPKHSLTTSLKSIPLLRHRLLLHILNHNRRVPQHILNINILPPSTLLNSNTPNSIQLGHKNQYRRLSSRTGGARSVAVDIDVVVVVLEVAAGGAVEVAGDVVGGEGGGVAGDAGILWNSSVFFQQDDGSLHIGTTVWPCSLVLIKFAKGWAPPITHPQNPYSDLLDFRTKRVVELDAGCRVAAMGLYLLLGLTVVLITDIPAVMLALKRNLKRNKLFLGKNLKHVILHWNKADQIAALNPLYDVVVATNVVYIEEIVGQLISTMEAMVKDDILVLMLSKISYLL